MPPLNGDDSMETAKVWSTSEITPEAVIKMYDAVGIKLGGNIAVKVHSGEKGNQNFLRPEFLRPAIEHVGGTVVECNTAYSGARNTTEKHRELIAYHGWTKYFDVDLLDAEGPDMILPVKRGTVLSENHVGKNLANYTDLLVLSHFKGHPMGGFGGALKQLSIGIASSAGKSNIHSAGITDDQNKLWQNTAPQDKFCEAMADAAGSVTDYFGGRAVYVNMMCNLSVDCDCCAVAEDPCMKDIGILSSSDPVALDQACIDLVYSSKDPGRDHLVERIETRHGRHTIDAAAAAGTGTKNYELIRI